MFALTPRIPDRAANCADITVSFLGLGGLSAGERWEERGWEGGNWDIPGVSLHIWGGRIGRMSTEGRGWAEGGGTLAC